MQNASLDVNAIIALVVCAAILFLAVFWPRRQKTMPLHYGEDEKTLRQAWKDAASDLLPGGIPAKATIVPPPLGSDDPGDPTMGAQRHYDQTAAKEVVKRLRKARKKPKRNPKKQGRKTAGKKPAK